LSAAFGGTTIADALVRVLQQWLPISHAVADTIAVVLVTAVISYVSIVFGELTANASPCSGRKPSPSPSRRWLTSSPGWPVQ